MSFAYPHILWLLLVFPPALTLFFWWSWRKRQSLMTAFIQARLLPALVSGVSPTRQKVRMTCLVLAVSCLIFALARPQWGFSWQEVKQRGVDIVVAVDTSKSMLAEDIAPNRLARAKLAALELMQMARADRLGLVAFAGSAYLQCPLTIDDAAFRQSVEALDVNIIPEGGTALAEAINTALTAFKEKDNHKVLVLMTDGEDQDSGALEAAKKAAEQGLRIFTIGIGTPEGELLPDSIRDEEGHAVKSHLNATLLQQIAGATQGGFYLQLRGATAIDTLYKEGIAKLPKSEHQEKFVKEYQDRYQWPLGLAMVLLLVEMLLPERKREPKPRSVTAGATVVTSVIAVVLLWPGAAEASSSSALREYQSGQYDKALQEYQRLLQKKGDDPRLHFNAGAAAYRDRQYNEAAKQFDQALASPDLKLQQQAYYNRGNTLYRLGESVPDPTKRTENWEKAIKDYELSLKLNPQDADAKFNQQLVKKRLEQLKQQQQQQSQQNKSDQQKQDQNQQQQQQNGQQNQKQDQQKNQQQQQQQDQSGQKQDSSQQQQKQQQEQQQRQDQEQQQAAKQGQQEKDKQQQQAAQAGQQSKDKSEEQANAAAEMAGQMTPEQARQLLDAQKGEEKMLVPKQENKAADSNRHLRDW